MNCIRVWEENGAWKEWRKNKIKLSTLFAWCEPTNRFIGIENETFWHFYDEYIMYAFGPNRSCKTSSLASVCFVLFFSSVASACTLYYTFFIHIHHSSHVLHMQNCFALFFTCLEEWSFLYHRFDELNWSGWMMSN